jgi:hypothetical protein
MDEQLDEPVKKNKGGRPRKVAAPSLSEDQFSRLIEVLAQRPAGGGEGIDAATLREALAGAAKVSAEAAERAANPSNKTHPGLSCFSYPEGDVARARPTLPCAFFYNGYPMHKFPETEHWRELELAAQVQPGEYTTIRKDGSKMAVSVVGERDADGKLTKIEVRFPISREERWLVPPKAAVLYQLVYSDNPRKRFVEAMQEHLAMILGPEPVGA